VPIGWTLGVARNKLLESYRVGRVDASARRRLALEPVVLDDADIEAIVTLSETDVMAQLRLVLSEDQVRALSARVFDEHDYADIARSLECSETVVRKRVSRALKTLRERYEPEP
jgi:DNA-directed RNA polymerase specialized sigma24 family protein